MVDVRLPEAATRYSIGLLRWTLERWDTSTRFNRVAFTTPDESLVLPVSMSSLQVTRGAGTPGPRTRTEYTGYRRFLTGGRVIGD